MNKLAKYIVVSVICASVIFLAWYFSSILTCIIISAILALMGKPFMELLAKIKIGGYTMGNSLRAIITLLAIGGVASLLILFIIPLVGNLISELTSMNWDEINLKLSIPLMKYNIMLHQLFPTMDPTITIESLVMTQVKSLIGFNLFTNAINSVASFLMHLLVSGFTIIFVTFFFLKDTNTFSNMILVFVPTKYEASTSRALESVHKLLIRYFSGICIETLFITILNTIGLHLIGDLTLQLAIALAFLSGILNVIPYIGPIIAGAIGTIIGVISHYGTGAELNLGILLLTFVLIFFITHLVDVFVFQPYIYSNSVKAHPLEIFLVILLAGNIAGITGMLVAIPTYTVIRVFAKEFLSNFKVVQKLTGKMDIN